MYFLYNISVYIIGFLLKIIAPFNKKINLFVAGRKNVFEKLEAAIKPNDTIIWFHCASLGEFEQGRPIIEKAKQRYPNHKILLTFFSPSGYEIRKNYGCADFVAYLPLDTKKNAQRLLQIINPEIAIFIKYEFWPNLLKVLRSQNIKTILVSGIFRKEQSFFKSYGRWMRKSLQTFDHFFVQNNRSKGLLESIGFLNVTVSGDTRFDRVFDITQQDNTLAFAERFTGRHITLIAGSTWPKDEELLVSYINTNADANQKFIIAPHNINANDILKLKERISKNTILYSERKNKRLEDYQVLIIDTIGLLSKIYNYADIAYVGGGFGSGIHNILEPATFGVPILIGPTYHKFKEAVDLVKLGACEVITNQSEFNAIATTLFTNAKIRKQKGAVSGNYILKNVGATDIIVKYLDNTINKK